MVPPTESRPARLGLAPLLVLLATISLLFPGAVLSQNNPLPPMKEGETRWMFGHFNPKGRAPNDANALVLVRPLSAGVAGTASVVRALGAGLPGCEVACVRKVGNLRDEHTGQLNRMGRKFIYDTSKNEIQQQLRIERRFDASGSRNTPFFPRVLGHQITVWPYKWPYDGEYSRTIETYQEFIAGKTLQELMENYKSLGMTKKDVLSVGVAYMKGIFSALQMMDGFQPPMEHNDGHAGNVIIGYTGIDAPQFTNNKLPGRAYLIDYGLTKTSEQPRAPMRNDKDLLLMRDTLSVVLKAAGIDTKKVEEDYKKGGLKLSKLLQSDADKAVRKAYGYLTTVVWKVKKRRPEGGPSWWAPVTAAGAQTTKTFKDLASIYSSVTETYSPAFRAAFFRNALDPRAEPLSARSRNELRQLAHTKKVAGPWFYTQVTMRGGQLVVKKLHDDKWCDWGYCAMASQGSQASAGKRRFAPEEVEDWEWEIDNEDAERKGDDH